MTNASSYYIYFISSLPMLHFGAKPPFLFTKFLGMCEGVISEKDIEILKNVAAEDERVSYVDQPTEKKWRDFDTALRNELVRVRAARKHVEPVKYLRDGAYSEPSIAHLAMNAHRNPSILEAEEMLDRERWRILDEISVGHYFDIDFLIMYTHKLLILERWERINTADKPKTLEAVLEKVAVEPL